MSGTLSQSLITVELCILFSRARRSIHPRARGDSVRYFLQHTYPRSRAPSGFSTTRGLGCGEIAVTDDGGGFHIGIENTLLRDVVMVPRARPANGENAARRKYTRTHELDARTHKRDLRPPPTHGVVVFIPYGAHVCIKWRRQTIRQRRVTPPPQPATARAGRLHKKKN